MSDEKPESPPMMWKVIVPSVLAIAVIVPLSMKLNSGGPPPSASEGADLRIAPVASVKIVKAASGPRTGESIYNSVCAACHGTGAAGAPKKGDKAAWAPRLGQGIDGLVKSAVKGKNAMPPKGGASDLSDAELKSVIEYMTK